MFFNIYFFPYTLFFMQSLNVKEKKNLRLSSASIKRRLQDHDPTFKDWKLKRIRPAELKQLADDIEHIEGEYLAE